MSVVVDIIEGAADFVGDVIESAGEFVADAFDAVVDVVEDIGNAVVDAAEAIGDVLGDIGEFAQVLVERYAIQVALMSMGIPPVYAAPMSAGMHTLARGGSPEDALKSAATTALIQQTGKAISEGMQAANADAVAQGGAPIYSATEIAAATSAAQSAIATAASGGDVKDAVLGAAIGGISGATATEVYNQTGSLAAANFTRVTMQATLQGVEVEQAILMGASATMVTYLQNMNETATKSTEISNSRAASIRAYQDRVEGYNAKLALYNEAKAAGDVTTANRYAGELNRELEIINNLSAQIGSYNQQLKELSDEYMKQQTEAEAEAKRTDFDFKSKTQAQLDAEQQQRDEMADELGRMIAETEGRRYEGIDIAAGQLPAGIEESFRTLPLVGEDVISENEGSDAIRRTVVGTLPNGEEYSYNIVIDKTDGSVFYETFTEQGLGGTTIAYDERPVFNEVGGMGTASVGELVSTRPTLTELEIQQINEAARGGRATSIRSAAEDYLFEQELEDLEAELESAASDAERASSRAQFVQQQRERLSQAQRLPGTLQAQIDAELNQILDEYEQSKGEAAEKAATKERIVATQQGRRGTVSDEEVMRLLGLTSEEGQRYGLGTGGGGEGFAGIPEGTIEGEEEAPLEGEMELGGGEGEGEPTAQRFDAQGRPITSTAVVRPRQELGGRGETPGIPSRVTGEALVGILGEKEPLFGGDEDQQQAVWNRRSLRLRKALGL
jgi:hypothetical protein